MRAQKGYSWSIIKIVSFEYIIAEYLAEMNKKGQNDEGLQMRHFFSEQN